MRFNAEDMTFYHSYALIKV